MAERRYEPCHEPRLRPSESPPDTDRFHPPDVWAVDAVWLQRLHDTHIRPDPRRAGRIHGDDARAAVDAARLQPAPTTAGLPTPAGTERATASRGGAGSAACPGR